VLLLASVSLYEACCKVASFIWTLGFQWVGGVDVMALPLLRGVVHAAMQLAARQFAVFPR
jgi:hypothetical protein